MTNRQPRRRPSAAHASFEWRRANSLFTAMSAKTLKGEYLGWVTGILYLQPHSIASDKTLCPFSTEACRRDCLVTSGMGFMPKQQHARTTRTLLLNDDRQAFLARLALEIIDLETMAARHDMRLAIRLNGTSDIIWEREVLEDHGKNLFDLFPRVQFYDYTKIPLNHRAIPANYHLTYSLADDNWDRAVDYLLSGQSVAAIVEETKKWSHEAWFSMGDRDVNVVDGDLHDLRFLDPPGSLVQIRPKGTMNAESPMVHDRLIRDLMQEAINRSVAAAG